MRRMLPKPIGLWPDEEATACSLSSSSVRLWESGWGLLTPAAVDILARLYVIYEGEARGRRRSSCAMATAQLSVL
jgi:hypothetical protein